MESDKKSIVPISNAVIKLSNQIAIGDKLLQALNSEKLKNLLIELSKDFNISLKRIIQVYYNISESFLEEYSDILNWAYLSSNPNLPWSINFIEKYNTKWDWTALSCNSSLPWSMELFEKYEQRWDWEELSEIDHDDTKFENFTRSEKFIKKHIKKFDFEFLSYVSFIPWSFELIEQYYEKWDWEALSRNSSLPWSIELIRHYRDKWDWMALSSNTALPWSISFIEEFIDEWDWQALSSNSFWSIELFERYSKRLNTYLIGQRNENIKWDENLLLSYNNDDIWYFISRSETFPWSENIVKKYKYNWDWEALSMNPNLPWSVDFIYEFKEFIDWKYLGWNTRVKWNEDLIDTYLDKWDWKYLSSNPALPWSVEFFDRYSNLFVKECLVWTRKNNWDNNFTYEESGLYVDLGVFDKQPKLDFNFVKKQEIIIDFYQISRNKELNWTIDLLIEYKNKIDWEGFLRTHNQYWNDIQFLSMFKEEIKIIDNHRLKWGIMKQLINGLNGNSVIELLKNPKIN